MSVFLNNNYLNMRNYYPIIRKIILLLFIFLSTDITLFATTQSKEVILVDEEYTKFKNQGDEFFVQGQYRKALKKYYSCLEVPSFSNDEYAKKQIEICEKAIQLNEAVELAISKKKNEKAITYLEEIYSLNKADVFTKKRLKDFYDNIGSEKMEKGEYQDAVKAFKSSLLYSFDKHVDLLIRTCQEKIDNPKGNTQLPNISQNQVKKIETESPPNSNVIVDNSLTYNKRSPLVQIVVGVVGAGSAIYALSINSDWTAKLNALNTAKSSGNISTYETAYTNALQVKNTEGLRNACVGIALASVATEIYLLIRKPKSTISKFGFAPTNNAAGLSINYKF